MDVSVRIGSSFDITGMRKQANFKIDLNEDLGNAMDETIEVELKNARDTDAEVQVRETLYRWVNWDILEASHEYEQVDARTVHFPVTVPAQGSVTVRYTTRYEW